MRLRAVPLTLAEANLIVRALHRHHKPATGHRFSVGAVNDDGVVCGAAIVGRPVARMLDQSQTCEVLRVATDGTKNACSFLLGACARAARALGYARIQTYTLESETGASLRGAGWIDEGEAGGGNWNSGARERSEDQPMCAKRRWSKTFSGRVEWRLSGQCRQIESGNQAQLFGGPQ